MTRNKKYKKGQLIWYGIVLIILTVIGLYLPSYHWLESSLKLALQIVVGTSLASFLGNLIEERNWTLLMKKYTSPITQWAKLPSVSASAIFSSFFSLVTANSMLSAAYEKQQMSRRQLCVSAMCTSFMSYLYHSLRIMYPTIAAIGLVGASYFALLFGFGFVVVLIALLLSRYGNDSNQKVDCLHIEEEAVAPENWKNCLKNSRKKTYVVIRRMVFIAIPLFLFFSFLNEIGFFAFSNNLFLSPELRELFPPESLAVASSMLGGILSAATVAAGLMQNGSLEAPHVLMALLVGNIISLPIRSLRRSLPSAMSVFPAKEAILIVLLNQGSRLLSNIILLMGLLFLMYHQLV